MLLKKSTHRTLIIYVTLKVVKPTHHIFKFKLNKKNSTYVQTRALYKTVMKK